MKSRHLPVTHRETVLNDVCIHPPFAGHPLRTRRRASAFFKFTRCLPNRMVLPACVFCTRACASCRRSMTAINKIIRLRVLILFKQIRRMHTYAASTVEKAQWRVKVWRRIRVRQQTLFRVRCGRQMPHRRDTSINPVSPSRMSSAFCPSSPSKQTLN